MAIYSCMGCVAPKRHPGCHGHCREYLTDKVKHDEEKAEKERRESIEHGLDYHFAKVAIRVKKARHQKG